MDHPDAVNCWRNRQAEIEFHILRHEWFLGKAAVLHPDSLQHKIDAYRLEWTTYDRLIRSASAKQPRGVKSAA